MVERPTHYCWITCLTKRSAVVLRLVAGVVEAALALGANPRLRDELGWTALMACCRLIEGASGKCLLHD